ncbi:MAG: dethiobiotin synthase [Aquificota bacterium]|nr:dethiobiotin synthase [Aquificota bacterium]
MGRSVLITGTDTGVGKTYVTYNLALALRKKGVKVGCFKPVETYVRDIPEDGLLLSEATGQPVDEVVPVRFSLPLSPYAAEMEEGRPVDLGFLKGGLRSWREDTTFFSLRVRVYSGSRKEGIHLRGSRPRLGP